MERERRFIVNRPPLTDFSGTMAFETDMVGAQIWLDQRGLLAKPKKSLGEEFREMMF